MPRPVVRDERRAQIVQAALRLVRSAGVHGFTIADVATEAGVSRGILHYHFVSKEEIIHEALLSLLLQFGRRAMEAALAAPDHPRARLHALIDASLNERELPFYAALLEFWSPALRDAAHRRAMAALYDGGIVFVANIVQRGVAQGELPNCQIAPRDLACALAALHDGLMVQRLIRRQWMPVTRARAIAHATLDSLLGTPAARPAPVNHDEVSV